MLERAPYVLNDSRLLVQRYLQLSEEVGREPDEDILQRMHAVLASAGIHTPEGKTTRSSDAPAEEVIRDAPAGTPSCATWVRRCAGSRRNAVCRKRSPLQALLLHMVVVRAPLVAGCLLRPPVICPGAGRYAGHIRECPFPDTTPPAESSRRAESPSGGMPDSRDAFQALAEIERGRKCHRGTRTWVGWAILTYNLDMLAIRSC